MNFQELIKGKTDKQIGFLSTATTGLNVETDELLAVSVLWEEDKNIRTATYIRKVEINEAFAASAPYHGVSEHQVRTEGLDDEEFVRKVNELIKGKALFTYNIAFQKSFLLKAGITTGVIYNMPLWAEAAWLGLPVVNYETDSLIKLEDQLLGQLKKVQGFKRLLESLEIEPASVAFLLPCENSCSSLLKVWEKLATLQATAVMA